MNAYNYRQTLKEKFKHTQEIKKIQRHRHMPKYIHNAQKKKTIQTESKHKKLKNQEINNPNRIYTNLIRVCKTCARENVQNCLGKFLKLYL